MSDINEIVAAIIFVVPKRNQKVAMTIATVERLLPAAGDDERDAFVKRIADRIVALASNGTLVGHGNLRNWRHAEVRLADDQ